MVRQILKWCDRKEEEAVQEEKMSKAVYSGAVEGAINAIVVLGTLVLTSSVAYIVKDMIKK